MWHKIKCWLGFHKWVRYETTQGLRWYCTRCGKIDR